jgi:chromate reductase
MMGASAGMMGTGRAQYHLRQTCVFLNMLPLNKPEVFVAAAATKFDASGRLTDETLRTRIRQLLEALAAWTQRLRGDR